MIHDPTRRWMQEEDLPCRKAGLDTFFPDGPQNARHKPSGKRLEELERAKAVCKTCPVMHQCRRDTLGEEFGVFGGLDEWERYQIRSKLWKAYHTTWSESKKRAWQSYIYGLYSLPIHPRRIKSITGIPERLVTRMVKDWEDYQELMATRRSRHLRRVKRPRQKNPVQPRADFPEKPGSRHCWVLDGNYAADCWYRAQTPDGAWIWVEIHHYRAHAHRWVRAEKVRIYNPQPIVIKEYKGRPDAKRSKQVAA